MKCHPKIQGRRHRHRFGKREMPEVALVGNPNTGKSCLFNNLTGMGAVISNYPGTTVDILEGKSDFKGKLVRVVDLPGIYALGSTSEDEKVTKEYIINQRPELIVNVVDANLLERNLYLTLQLLELKIPMIVALNFYEELEDKGVSIDAKKLELQLGVPVIPVDALRGAGISDLVSKGLKILNGVVKLSFYDVTYDDHIEKAVSEISRIVKRGRIPLRAVSLNLIEEDKTRWDELEKEDANIAAQVKKIVKNLSKEHVLSTEISGERHGQAALIATKVSHKGKSKKNFKDRLDRFTTEPLTGTVSLVIILAIMFSALFYLGGYLSEVFGRLFEGLVMNPLNPFISGISNKLLRTSIFWSLDGINAGIQIALPYIAVFYILLAFLEDTGYLPRMAYLLDRMMHKLHLHGKAVVPMMLGFGCSVPAILATRVLPNKRERILTAILVSLVPCSARTAVILGAVGKFIGAGYALLIYGIVLLLIFLIGYVLGKLLPGEATGLILEMPEFRLPFFKNVFRKTWFRVKGFVYIAFPLVIIGSVVLGLLKEYGLLDVIMKPFEPLIGGWLMLPAAAGITLVYGILRKELALEMLFVLGGSAMLLDFMSPLQIFVFALVVTLYIPCLGTFAVLKHEFGWKNSLLIAFFTIALAVVIGGLVGRLFMLIGVLV